MVRYWNFYIISSCKRILMSPSNLQYFTEEMFFLEFSLRFILLVLLDFDLVLVQFALTRDVRPRGPAPASRAEISASRVSASKVQALCC